MLFLHEATVGGEHSVHIDWIAGLSIKQNVSPLASGTGSRMTILLHKIRIPAMSGGRKRGYFHHKFL